MKGIFQLKLIWDLWFVENTEKAEQFEQEFSERYQVFRVILLFSGGGWYGWSKPRVTKSVFDLWALVLAWVWA